MTVTCQFFTHCNLCERNLFSSSFASDEEQSTADALLNPRILATVYNGAGTILKVGAHARNFFCRAPPFFGSASTVSRFGESFRDGHYS